MTLKKALYFWYLYCSHALPGWILQGRNGKLWLDGRLKWLMWDEKGWQW